VTAGKTITEIDEVRNNIPAENRDIPLALPWMLGLEKFMVKSLKKKASRFVIELLKQYKKTIEF
jgi:hypothetical protein